MLFMSGDFPIFSVLPFPPFDLTLPLHLIPTCRPHGRTYARIHSGRARSQTFRTAARRRLLRVTGPECSGSAYVGSGLFMVVSSAGFGSAPVFGMSWVFVFGLCLVGRVRGWVFGPSARWSSSSGSASGPTSRSSGSTYGLSNGTN